MVSALRKWCTFLVVVNRKVRKSARCARDLRSAGRRVSPGCHALMHSPNRSGQLGGTLPLTSFTDRPAIARPNEDAREGLPTEHERLPEEPLAEIVSGGFSAAQ